MVSQNVRNVVILSICLTGKTVTLLVAYSGTKLTVNTEAMFAWEGTDSDLQGLFVETVALFVPSMDYYVCSLPLTSFYKQSYLTIGFMQYSNSMVSSHDCVCVF